MGETKQGIALGLCRLLAFCGRKKLESLAQLETLASLNRSFLTNAFLNTVFLLPSTKHSILQEKHIFCFKSRESTYHKQRQAHQSSYMHVHEFFCILTLKLDFLLAVSSYNVFFLFIADLRLTLILVQPEIQHTRAVYLMIGIHQLWQ